MTEEWHQILPMIGFALTFIVFAVMMLRALLMRRERCRTLAFLPLEEDTPPPPVPVAVRPSCTGRCLECRCARDSQ